MNPLAPQSVGTIGRVSTAIFLLLYAFQFFVGVPAFLLELVAAIAGIALLIGR